MSVIRVLLKRIIPPKLIGLLLNVLNKRAIYKIRVFKLIFKPDPQNRKLNIGGGRWLVKGWENLDWYVHDVYCDYKQNLLVNQNLPFEDSSVSRIFTSHVLEHLDDEVVLKLLKECKRVLKEGGVLRIVVPDMEKAFEAYYSNDEEFFQTGEISLVGDSIERRFINFFASFAIENYGGQRHYSGGPIIDDNVVSKQVSTLDRYDFVKWCESLIPKQAPYIAHRNGFDYKKLRSFLEIAGFTRISRSTYKGSINPEMRGAAFDKRPKISLFIEAVNAE
ncbi:hypothetical protein ES703_44306 [subsurface metagenome]